MTYLIVVFKNNQKAFDKIIASQKSSIQFEVSDKLEHLYVKNGDFVPKGKLLASLNSFKYQQRLSRVEIELKKAKFQFKDMLVGRGIFTTRRVFPKILMKINKI